MAYCTVTDLRDEGLSETLYPDAHVEQRIKLSQQMIENLTGRFFELRSDYSMKIDGTGYDMLWLQVPPVSENTELVISISGEVIDVSEYQIIMPNFPDGRFNPKIMKANGIWSKGKSNIEITGNFGFVDKEGNTPIDIIDLCTRIVIWGIEKRADTDAAKSKRIVEESIKTFSYRLRDVNTNGQFGDEYIDGMIDQYRLVDMFAV